MIKPISMGCVMGAMMLWMLHGTLTGSGVTGWALAIFVAAHVVLVLFVGTVAVFAARLSPRARSLMSRIHRPSLRHVAAMTGTAVLVITAVHLGAHGVGGIS